MGRPRRIVPRVRVALNLDPLVEIDRLALEFVQAYARENLLPPSDSSTLRAGIEMLLREAVLARVHKTRLEASRQAGIQDISHEVGATAPAQPPADDLPRVAAATTYPAMGPARVEQPPADAAPAVVVTRSASAEVPAFDFDTAGLSMPAVDDEQDGAPLPESMDTSWADDLQSRDVPPPVGLGARSSVILGFGVRAKT